MLRGLELLDSLKKHITEITMQWNAEIFNQFFYNSTIIGR